MKFTEMQVKIIRGIGVVDITYFPYPKRYNHQRNLNPGKLSMFIDELTPLFKELIQQPIAFTGGFFSGVFRLNLMDDPVKSWLDKQTGTTSPLSTAVQNGKSSGPQSISID